MIIIIIIIIIINPQKPYKRVELFVLDKNALYMTMCKQIWLKKIHFIKIQWNSENILTITINYLKKYLDIGIK